MKISKHLSITINLTFLLTLTKVSSAPTNSRGQKSLSYYDYDQQEDYQNYIDSSNEYLTSNTNNALRRNVPSKKIQKSFNSPIYYIRLPPQPYMYIPGLGYVSQPTQPNPDSFLNVPVNFISNGKPGMIYQWNGGFATFPTEAPPKVKPKTKPKPKPDSVIHRIPGKFVFNGKPNDIFVLSDKYNLYDNDLHSFYP